jgi:HAMP domain-containing protein
MVSAFVIWLIVSTGSLALGAQLADVWTTRRIKRRLEHADELSRAWRRHGD